MIEETTQFLLQFTEINVVVLTAVALFAKFTVDAVKLIKPEWKSYSLITVWIMAIILGALMVVGGQIGATILAIVIVGGSIAMIATGNHEQTKSIVEEQEMEELPEYHG